MPELPEVETSRRGIEPHILGKKIKQVVIREHKLRWPVPKSLPRLVDQQVVTQVKRRGKYLLIVLGNTTPIGTILIHLGMSGSLRICSANTPAEKHDHIDFVFTNRKILRLKDPRKFGSVLWTDKPVEQHKLLIKLGPEPLAEDFNADYFYQKSRQRSCSIKSFIMNSHIVVGVGNIYACESLFMAGIHPKRKAGSVSKQRAEKLVSAIKQVLLAAISQGGTTLRDFTKEDGQPGYFSQKLFVYGRAGEPCIQCEHPVRQFTQQQRSTFYCTRCQN